MSRFGLRSRLIVAFVGVSVVAAALVAVTSVVLTREAQLERVTGQAVDGTRADLLAAGRTVWQDNRVVEDETGWWRVLSRPQLSALVDELSLPEWTEVLVVQRGGHNYATSPELSPAHVPDALQARVRDGLLAHMRHERNGRPELVVGGRVASDALELYRFVDLSPVESDLLVLARSSAVAAALPVVLALLVGAVAASQVLRPIRRARDAARSVADGDLDVRVPVSGGDELAELGEDFNTMAASLKSSIDELHEIMARQRQFVADVAHELRTPLTALTAAVEVLEQEAGADTPDRRQAARLVVAEVAALRAMVEDLMNLSRFDAGAWQLDDHEVGLRNVIEGALHRRGITDRVDLRVPAELRVVADPRRLDAIVGNLVANALTHAEPPLRVSATVGPDGLYVDVADAGPGIPPEVRGRVFERFAKADAARTRTGGSGLGLAIARENARLHGGDVTLAETGPGGTTFRCHLPAERVLAEAGGRARGGGRGLARGGGEAGFEAEAAGRARP